MYLAHYKGVLCDKDLMGFVLPLSVEWKMGLAKLTSASLEVKVLVQFQFGFSSVSVNFRVNYLILLLIASRKKLDTGCG